jgi:phosphoserine phosphatase RsbU/P
MILGAGRSSIHTQMRTRRGTVLLTGVRSREFVEFSLFAMTSLDPVTMEIGRLQRHLFLTALFLLGVSIALGRFLSNRLLQPITELMKGIRAVEKQHLRHRISVQTRDELGEVSTMFNRMLESLEEISVGREVQQRLFPQGPLRLGEYVVHGRSRTASRLGGDYFEYLSIENRFLFVLLGDVTGHGIPAAIAMAICKGLVVDRAARNAGPADIIQTLNAGLLACLRRKLLLSATILWIDTRDHTSLFFNCGHPYPIHFTPNGKMTMLVGSGLPLGSSRQATQQPTPTSGTMSPGERILCYTDGLVESLPASPGQDQYNMWQSFLQSRPRKTLVETCDDILEHHPVSCLPDDLPDDFSLVLVERDGFPAQTPAEGGKA